jgi:hypothetical protein
MDEYTYDDLLQQVGGYTYYSQAQVRFVWHSLNNEIEQANHYKSICDQENEKVLEMRNKLIENKNKPIETNEK